ncbi:MAG: hypothetical protein O3B64_02165 [bacterium]|nr:hypothetical protein [bacterium]
MTKSLRFFVTTAAPIVAVVLIATRHRTTLSMRLREEEIIDFAFHF